MLLLMFVAWSPKFPRWCARWVGWLAGHWRYCGLISAYRPHTCTDHHPPCNTPSSPCHSTHGLPTQPTKTNMIEIFSLKGTFISSTERLFMSFKVIYTYLGRNCNSLGATVGRMQPLLLWVLKLSATYSMRGLTCMSQILSLAFGSRLKYCVAFRF